MRSGTQMISNRLTQVEKHLPRFSAKQGASKARSLSAHLAGRQRRLKSYLTALSHSFEAQVMVVVETNRMAMSTSPMAPLIVSSNPPESAFALAATEPNTVDFI
ncbi:hypothetical protein AN958_04624 [Leucoagaricus sp. SymC.cos]|nr:hypothetical protein AN958_04624 [Leucoagaricus sp. SymC.cos]